MFVQFYPWHAWQNGFGQRPEDNLMVQLPFIRLMTTGFPSVAVFFVISGYALSLKALKLIHSGRISDAYQAVGSSAFRRHPRLFLPAVTVSLLSLLFVLFGWYGAEPMPSRSLGTMNPPRFNTTGEQLADYFSDMDILLDPFVTNLGRHWKYNEVIWTLPHEFRGSFFVYGALFTFAQCRTWVRMTAMSFLALYGLAHGYWDIFCFYSGVIMAEVKLCTSASAEENPMELPLQTPESRSSRRLEGICGVLQTLRQNYMFQTVFWVSMYIFSLHVLGTPGLRDAAQNTPGSKFFGYHIPQIYISSGSDFKYWRSVGGVMVVFTIDRLPLLQSFYLYPAIQYLGKISFSLYLIHLPIVHCFAARFGRYFLGMPGERVPGFDLTYGYFWRFICVCIVMLSISIALSHLCYKYIDMKAVKFSAWLERKAMRKAPAISGL